MRTGVRKEPRSCGALCQWSQLAASSQAIDAGKLNRVIYPPADEIGVASEQLKERRTMRTETAVAIVPVAAPVSSSARFFQGILPPVVLVIGLIATLAWTALLGYGLVNAVALAF